jgi:hypothetical protein
MKTSKRTYSKGKNTLVALVVHVLHVWPTKELSSNDWQKPLSGKIAYLFVMYTSDCIVVTA